MLCKLRFHSFGQKLRNSIETLSIALPHSSTREQAITQLHGHLSELTRRPPKSTSALLGLEGRAGLAYFNAWQSLPLRWKGVGRHPIPHDWLTVGQRGTFARKKVGNRNASHPLNAILNYAYAILESQVRIQVLAAGYDPTIGFLHVGRRGRPDFVLDLMEPLRPIVDRKVLGIRADAHVSSGGFHDPIGWSVQAQSGDGEKYRRLRFERTRSKVLTQCNSIVANGAYAC